MNNRHHDDGDGRMRRDDVRWRLKIDYRAKPPSRQYHQPPRLNRYDYGRNFRHACACLRRAAIGSG